MDEGRDAHPMRARQSATRSGRSETGFPVLQIGYDPDLPPEVSEEMPPTVRERNSIGVRVARFLILHSGTMATIRMTAWLAQYAGHRIRAYLEPAKTLRELQDDAFEPKPGYEIHHIVEQTPARQDGFSNDQVNSPENRVRIPTYRHWEITAWYATKNEEFGNISPREFLRGQGWEARVAVGRYALVLHGVLKP